MSQALYIRCQHPADVPSIGDIQRLVTQHQHMVLTFSLLPDMEDVAFDKNSLIRSLTEQLPAYSVFNSGDTSGVQSLITVKYVIPSQEVLEHVVLFLNAIAHFHRTASHLMESLAEALTLSPTAFGERFIRVQLPRDKQQGQLGDAWRYWFHRGQCRFEHSFTNQIVEVELGFGTEFGVLDPYFLYQFVSTTDEHEVLARLLLDGYHDT